MVFTATHLEKVLVVDIERQEDERGFFARSWCRREFAAHGISAEFAQSSVSLNRSRGTLRGLHYQAAPYEEAKLVRCTRGAVYDVVVDIRAQSATFLQHVGVVLSAANHRALYVPEGCAHGFLTLSDDAEVLYHMSQVYEPTAARGVRWDDPQFGIFWPGPVRVVAERDRTYPDFQPDLHAEMTR
jgi:dTDP-4-dehydrorhamnose 3,5-epimerase